MTSAGEVTQLLQSWRDGNAEAPDRLFHLVYTELHARARSQRRRSWSLNTLDTTALVHESYLKLIGQSNVVWLDHTHFLAVASTAMRHIIINYAQRNQTNKRGGDWQRVTLDEACSQDKLCSDSLIAIEQALSQLDTVDPRLARIVEYRFFGGLSEKEIASVLKVTERTVRREWRKAKALLASSLGPSQPKNCQATAIH